MTVLAREHVRLQQLLAQRRELSHLIHDAQQRARRALRKKARGPCAGRDGFSDLSIETVRAALSTYGNQAACQALGVSLATVARYRRMTGIRSPTVCERRRVAILEALAGGCLSSSAIVDLCRRKRDTVLDGLRGLEKEGMVRRLKQGAETHWELTEATDTHGRQD
jgi:hypothetical protein